MSATSWTSRLSLVAVCAATLFVFSPTFAFEFLGWDDSTHLIENPYLQPPLNWAALRHFWTESYFRMYIPVTYSVWAAVVQMTTTWTASVFHALNVCLHTCNVVLVWVVIRRFGIGAGAASLGAMIFGLHPLQVEAVAWISALKDLLSGCLSLAGINFWLRFVSSPETASARRLTPIMALAAAVCFLLAVLAKPGAVVAPALALLLGHGLSDTKESMRRHGFAIVALMVWTLLIGSGATWMTIIAQPAQLIHEAAPVWARPFIAGDALAFWLRKVLVPVELAPDYGRTPRIVMQSQGIWLAWMVPAAVTATLWHWRRRWPIVLVAWLVFGIACLPNWGLVSFGFQNISTVADRYVYLGMVGVALAMAAVARSWSTPRMVFVGAGLGLALIWATSLQLRPWRTTESLFAFMLERNPASFTAAHGLGYAAHRKGDFAKAVPLYQQALQHNPRFADAYTNLATAYYQTGDMAAAITHFEKALSITPDDGVTLTNLGLALEKARRDHEAIERYVQAINATRSPYASFNLGALLARRGDAAGAMRAFRLAVTVMPRMREAWEKLGLLNLNQGELKQAEADFLQALALDSRAAWSWHGLARALEGQGRDSEAQAAFARAVEIDPALRTVISAPHAAQSGSSDSGAK